MGHILKDFVRKAAERAQSSLNIDPTKTERFVAQADQWVDKAGEGLQKAEKGLNTLENEFGGRLKAAKDAFMDYKQSQSAQHPPQDTTTPTDAPKAKKSAPSSSKK